MVVLVVVRCAGDGDNEGAEGGVGETERREQGVEWMRCCVGQAEEALA